MKRHSPSLKLNVTLGILAPRINIEKAGQLAEESKQRRERVRERSCKQREKTNLKHVEELKHAIIEYLDFDPKYSELADSIAQEATETSAELGSGRVGRTSKLTMKEKARLAARATLRHSYTGYDEMLESVKAELYGKLDDDTYREVKQDANQLVDEFLKEHKKKSTNAP